MIGPMYSGKSSRLIEEIEKNVRANKKCFIIRHNIDVRTPAGVLKTHGGIVFNNCPVIQTDTVSNTLNKLVVLATENKVAAVEEPTTTPLF